ncbi:MAG: phosphomannomutase/phosphoglucomutase [Spirochaetia bacterium]|jgi:phosphomannomutase
MGIFKSYDIRGIYDQEWNAATARGIGRHLPGLLEARRIAVGRDVRLSSEEIFRELTGGIMEAGCDVADIGLCDTPAVYFATAHFDMDGSVMITASHNPPEYNGLKVSRRSAVPVGYDTGLAVLEREVASGVAPARSPRPGALRVLDIRPDYLAHLAKFKSDLASLSAVIDCSNGMAGLFIRDVLDGTGLRYTLMFDEPDGRFPNHPPNPLVEENLAALKSRVRNDGADLGICFDGDADRVMFVDETGAFISPDLLIGFLGTYYFTLHPERRRGSSRTMTYDVRSSRGVVEFLRSLGAEPTICKVGHSFAKKLLRDTDGIAGGELAGHYYFRENFFCDSGMIAALIVLEVLSAAAVSFSRAVSEIGRYYFSGEINFTVSNGPEILRRLKSDFAGGSLTDLDGIRIDFPDWWFNLRVSNTEPLLRLVVEAVTREGLEKRKSELVERIQRYAAR